MARVTLKLLIAIYNRKYLNAKHTKKKDERKKEDEKYFVTWRVLNFIRQKEFLDMHGNVLLSKAFKIF